MAYVNLVKITTTNRLTGASLRFYAAKTKAMFFGTEYRVRTPKGSNLPGIELGDGVLVPFVN